MQLYMLLMNFVDNLKVKVITFTTNIAPINFQYSKITKKKNNI